MGNGDEVVRFHALCISQVDRKKKRHSCCDGGEDVGDLSSRGAE